ncbi:hypothetical protein [Clostridium sp.]|uniref:hypothetical protein n=1 Tax=Clostridium sp. TaxID=1506 RepID=UPI003217C7EF
MNVFKNINDETIWTLEDMKQLREDEKVNGLYVYDDFEEWIENKLETDFQRVLKG